MGVEIKKAGEPNRFEGMSYAERQTILRKERAERLAAHHKRDQEYQERGEAMFKDDVPPENKEDAPPENKDLGAMSKEDLVALAEKRNVTVTRADGREDLEPTKDDYLKALSES